MRPRETQRGFESETRPRLLELLRGLSEAELRQLTQNARIRIDPKKRIDPVGQVARALLGQAGLREVSRMPGPSRELLYRLVEARGVLTLPAIPEAAQNLVSRGILFVRNTADARLELSFPLAYALQLPVWEGEDPRGARALLMQMSANVSSNVASYYLGRPATPPLSLALEPAWEALSDPARIERELAALAPAERRLLSTIDELGGEVDTAELLNLEREPMRLRGVSGATLSRRGVGFALERRGFLLPVHPDRHIIPTEVGAVVGAAQRSEREAQRGAIRLFILAEDHEPRRARFATNPVPLVLAMALAIREPNVAAVRPGLGTPRSLIGRLAARFGQDPDTVAFLSALSRAIGLWDPSAASSLSPPGSLNGADLGRALFDAWRKGGAWDEARPEGETLRLPADLREGSAVGVVRDMVIEALQELGDSRWAPWEAIAAYVRSDSRTPGVARLVERWAARAGVEPLPPAEIARTIAVSSLHALGVVDLGDPDADDSEGHAPTLRITPRGRAYLGASVPVAAPEPSRFVDSELLRIGSEVLAGDILGLAPFVEVGAVTARLDLRVTPRALAQAISDGFDPELVAQSLGAIAELPDSVSRVLVQASAVLGRAEFVETQGFLWVDDHEIREMLRTRRQTADLFVDPSPPGGLLLARGVDLERLARRCRALGVDIVVQGRVYRTHSIDPVWRATEPSAPLETESPSSGVRESVGGRPRPTRLYAGRGL